MKIIYGIVIFFFVSVNVSAQFRYSYPEMQLELKPDARFLNSSTINLPKAKVIGQTEYGTIYALPQDNMPCLVPDISLVKKIPMPEYFFLSPAIPNPYYKNEFTPGSQSKNPADLNLMSEPKINSQN